MKKLLFFALIALAFSFTANAQQFHWARSAYSNVKIASDRAGNIYTLGYTQGGGMPVDVDPGPNVVNVPTSPLGFNTVYVMKYNKQGTIVWTTPLMQQTFYDEWDLAVDDSQNVYVTGFMDYSGFDPMTVGFLQRINNNGSLGWDVVWGDGNIGDYARGSSVAVDSMGNVYATGFTAENADMDPGPGSEVTYGKFIVKYTNNGDYVWHTMGGSLLLEVSRDGNSIYTTEPLLYDQPTILSKWNGGGILVWSHIMDSVTFTDLNVSEAGKVYATGYFVDTTDLDPGVGVAELATAGGKDQFLLKLDTAGAFIWAKQLGSSAIDKGIGVVYDKDGFLYTCGIFSDTVDMDPGTGVFHLTSITPDTADIYIQKLDTDGNFIWAEAIGNPSPDESFGMTIDTAGAIIFIGQAYGADMDPGAPTVPVNAYNFITKWSDTILSISAKTVLNIENNIILYPNPSNRIINVSAKQVIDNISVTDISGRVIFTSSPANKRTSVDIPTPGVYFISVTTGGNVSRGKVLIQ